MSRLLLRLSILLFLTSLLHSRTISGFALTGRQAQLMDGKRYELHSPNDPLLSYLKPNPDETLLFDVLKGLNGSSQETQLNEDEPSLESLLDRLSSLSDDIKSLETPENNAEIVKKRNNTAVYNSSNNPTKSMDIVKPSDFSLKNIGDRGIDLKGLVEKVTQGILTQFPVTLNEGSYSEFGPEGTSMNISSHAFNNLGSNSSSATPVINVFNFNIFVMNSSVPSLPKQSQPPSPPQEKKEASSNPPKSELLTKLLKDRLNHQRPDSHLLESILRSSMSPEPRRATSQTSNLGHLSDMSDFFTQLTPGPSPYWAPLLSGSKSKRSTEQEDEEDFVMKRDEKKHEDLMNDPQLRRTVINSLKKNFEQFLLMGESSISREKMNELLSSNSSSIRSILSEALRNNKSKEQKGMNPMFFLSDRRDPALQSERRASTTHPENSDWLTAQDILHFYKDKRSSPAIIVPIIEEPNISYEPMKEFQADTAISDIVQNLHQKSSAVNNLQSLDNRELIELYQTLGSISDFTARHWDPKASSSEEALSSGSKPLKNSPFKFLVSYL